MSLAAVIERSRHDRENWKYTDLKPLSVLDFKPPPGVASGSNAKKPAPVLPSIVANEAERHRIVFINGIWQPELSRLEALPQDIISGDPRAGYQITLAGAVCLVTAPVELVFLTDNATQPLEVAMNLAIDIGPSGRLTLIEHHMGSSRSDGAAVARIIDTTIRLGEQAKLVHGKIVHGDGATVHLTATRVTVAAGAYYDNFKLTKGGKLVRDEIEVTLAGPLAQCSLNGLMLLRGADHADTTTRIAHTAPHGTSRQVYKSVVGDKARGVFQGKITVDKGAQKTDGHQLSRALLLSDQAEMDAKPELEIYADDVKCSHGTAIGDLDANALFYLRARGLNESEARTVLIRAFIDEIIDEIQVTEWRDHIRASVEGWLNEPH